MMKFSFCNSFFVAVVFLQLSSFFSDVSASKEDVDWSLYESKKDYYNKTNSTSDKPTDQQFDKDEYLKKTSIAIFSMEYLPIGHLRTDPIISQTCLSDHVHTFYGPPLVHPAVSYEELRGNDPKRTSGNVQENQSLYWHPTIYRVHSDGTHTIVEPDWVTIYYAYSAHGKTTAFPEGFRMIGRSPTNPLKVESVCYGNASPCVEEDGITPCKAPPSITSNNSSSVILPLEACDGEMGLVLLFPSCWDGVNLDSIDHQSHVAYAQGAEDATLKSFASAEYTLGAKCPTTHPVAIPQILLFIRLMKYPGGYHVLSNNDAGPSAAGDWHGDYIMGWDEEFLQSVLKGCVINKEIPCGSTRRDDIRVDQKNKFATVETLQKARIAAPKTSCLTVETINNTKVIPRGGCSGNLLSSDSCEEVTDAGIRTISAGAATAAKNSMSLLRISFGVLALTLLLLGNISSTQ